MKFAVIENKFRLWAFSTFYHGPFKTLPPLERFAQSIAASAKPVKKSVIREWHRTKSLMSARSCDEQMMTAREFARKLGPEDIGEAGRRGYRGEVLEDRESVREYVE